MIYEVGYDCGDGIFSVNLLEGNLEIVRQTADTHAKRFGYRVAYISQVSQSDSDSKRYKGMPYEKVS